MSAGRLAVGRLGRVPYADALARQRALAEDRIAGRLATDVLLLLEHPPVVTLGRGTRATSLPVPAAALQRRGIEVHEIERGGDVTYHGPGQLVGYPIFDLAAHRKDLHWFLRQVEQALILALAHFSIVGERREGYTGVWTDGRKIASIGIHVRQWVTWHGFALNVTTDLAPFDLIVPCGIPGVVMTSVARELEAQGHGATEARESPVAADLMDPVREAVIAAFAEVFGFEGIETFAGAATPAGG